MQGVIRVLTADDIPGENNIGHFVDVEPLLPKDEVVYVGQPVALVVAKDEKTANQPHIAYYRNRVCHRSFAGIFP